MKKPVLWIKWVQKSDKKDKRRRQAILATWVLFISLFVGIFISAQESSAVEVTDCSAIGQLRNGNFESPKTTQLYDGTNNYPAGSNSVTNIYGVVGGSYWNHLDATADDTTYRNQQLQGSANDTRMYWYTTEASNQLEIAEYSSSYGVPADSNNRLAELNATARGALFQDISTVPGVTIRWSLQHRGRSGTETMRVSIGRPTNSISTVMASASQVASNSASLQANSDTRTDSARAGLVIQNARRVSPSTSETTTISDGTSAWGTWYGSYTETSTTTQTTRFMFEAITPTTGGSGNLLDNIVFAPVAACPITRTLNSSVATATINVFDTSTGSSVIVPNEAGHSESITSLTKVDGPGTASLANDGRTFTFTPNGAGTTNFKYTITYVANNLATTSDGTIAVTARDVLGGASCSSGSFESATSTTNGQTEVILTFKTPTQANTDNDNDHRSGTCSWTVPEGVNAVDYLVVGGGGGGASGGGGGGGVVTSWATAMANNTSTQRTPARNPLAVTPGEEISITVGGGGKPGWGGNYRAGSNQPTRTPTKGSDSRFGSVVAEGGGFGGGPSQAAGGDGGSGGGSRFDAQASSGVATASQVVGASSFGNAGGGSTESGQFRAGGGGGGAGTSDRVSDTPTAGAGGLGGLIRNIPYVGGNNQGTLIAGSTSGGGGHGGRGVSSAIASFSNQFNEYGCGGGGGVNNNLNVDIPNGGGLAGCSSAGAGSSFGTMYTTTSSTQFNGTAVPTESFGGGGGGTDPEGNIAGSGGSGVVIIRYTLSNINCPNSANNTTVAGPIACPYPITITAGAAVATSYNLGYGDATNGYVSFPRNNNDTVTVTTTLGNGIDTVTVNVTGRSATFAVSNASTALAGATYPMRYTIFSGNQSSSSFVLLRINDPAQATPIVIPVDPRATFVDLTGIRLGGTQMNQVCFTPIANTTNTGYGNLPSIDTFTSVSATATLTTALGRLRLQGTNANLQAGMNSIRVTKHPSDTYLLPGDASRRIRVNVSNRTVGGNGSCTFGTDSVLELKPISISQQVRLADVQQTNR